MEIYHVLNRGVDKRKITLDDTDRLRFLHNLFVFNDQHSAYNYMPSKQHKKNPPRKLLVHIHAFCLMPNHYHLLISPIIENGIALFMKKISMGYTKYFNKRHTRSGALWQGKYKKVLIENNAHFIYIPYYIHLNALDMKYPQWRQGNVKNTSKAMKCLNEYRWSSHLDYNGIKNFPSITQREFLSPILGTKQKYENEIANIITNPDTDELQSSLLE